MTEQQFLSPAAGQQGATGKDPAKKNAAAGCGCLVVMVAVAIGFVVALFGDSDSDDDTTGFTDDDTTYYRSDSSYGGNPIPMFNGQDMQRLSEQLAGLERTYGLCFGWSLQDGATKRVQTGSSRGPNVPADTCPRWIAVQVGVGYEDENSSSNDAADIQVKASPELDQRIALHGSDFAALGLDADALIADPVAATGHAALALPLLMVEEGAIEPAPQPPTGAPPQAKPLPAADGSDFPVGSVVLLAALGAGAIGSIVLGVVLGRRRKRDSGGQGGTGGPGAPPPGPPPQQPPPPPAQPPPPHWQAPQQWQAQPQPQQPWPPQQPPPPGGWQAPPGWTPGSGTPPPGPQGPWPGQPPRT